MTDGKNGWGLGQDPSRVKSTKSLLLSSSQRGEGMGSDGQVRVGPAAAGKRRCACHGHLRRPWEGRESWEPGKAHPVPMASVQSNWAASSWLILFLCILMLTKGRPGERNSPHLWENLPKEALPATSDV